MHLPSCSLIWYSRGRQAGRQLTLITLASLACQTVDDIAARRRHIPGQGRVTTYGSIGLKPPSRRGEQFDGAETSAAVGVVGKSVFHKTYAAFFSSVPKGYLPYRHLGKRVTIELLF